MFEIAETEYQSLKRILSGAKIDFDEIRDNGKINIAVERGYLGFVTEFIFSEETEKLLDMGAYE